MASEAKDVGILAMDIYFPPNCVLQVPSPVAISVSPRARFAFPSAVRFQGARAGGVDTNTAPPHALRGSPAPARPLYGCRGFRLLACQGCWFR